MPRNRKRRQPRLSFSPHELQSAFREACLQLQLHTPITIVLDGLERTRPWVGEERLRWLTDLARGISRGELRCIRLVLSAAPGEDYDRLQACLPRSVPYHMAASRSVVRHCGLILQGVVLTPVGEY